MLVNCCILTLNISFLSSWWVSLGSFPPLTSLFPKAPNGPCRPVVSGESVRCWSPHPSPTPTKRYSSPQLLALLSPQTQMDILKDLTTTLVEHFQAPILASCVCGPGLATTAVERNQSPDEEGSRETLHSEGLCVTN